MPIGWHPITNSLDVEKGIADEYSVSRQMLEKNMS